MQKHLLIMLLGVLCLGLASTTFGQETRGAILGRVTDSSGSVIPGVTVRATNVATNVSVTAQSSSEGS